MSATHNTRPGDVRVAPGDRFASLQEDMRSQLQSKELMEEQAKQGSYECIASVLSNSEDVYPTEEKLRDLSVFDEPIPEHCAENGQHVLQLLNEFGAPSTVRHTGGRYFVFVTGGVIPVAGAARLISDT
jgi:hypothetical protein